MPKTDLGGTCTELVCTETAGLLMGSGLNNLQNFPGSCTFS